jgi:hypothetical protein
MSGAVDGETIREQNIRQLNGIPALTPEWLGAWVRDVRHGSTLGATLATPFQRPAPSTAAQPPHRRRRLEPVAKAHVD